MVFTSRFALAAVAGILGACCASAWAAPRGIGTLVREMTPGVARCLIQRYPALVDRWLRTLPGTPEEDRLVRNAEPRFPVCFDPFAQRSKAYWVPEYNVPNMRSALVRALLQARRRDLPADAPPAGLPWYPAAPGSLEGGAAASAILASDLGLCLARRHWRNVVAIVEAVDAKTESFNFGYAPEETEASKRESALVESELAKIIPSIAGCFPAGAKLRIDRRRLRSLLEEAAYHMTNGPAASGPASGDRQGGAR